MARFCLLVVAAAVLLAAASWWVATALLDFTGFSAFLITLAVFLFCLLLLTLLSRLVRGRRQQAHLRDLAALDDDGTFVHLADQTSALKRMTGAAVGFLVTPSELAEASDDALLGPIGVAMQLQEAVAEYMAAFGSEQKAREQAEASSAVAGQVRDLYFDQLRARGWSDQRIQRSALSALRMARMVNRRRSGS